MMVSENKQNKYMNWQKFCLENVYYKNFSQKCKKCLCLGTGKNTKYG